MFIGTVLIRFETCFRLLLSMESKSHFPLPGSALGRPARTWSPRFNDLSRRLSPTPNSTYGAIRHVRRGPRSCFLWWSNWTSLDGSLGSPCRYLLDCQLGLVPVFYIMPINFLNFFICIAVDKVIDMHKTPTHSYKRLISLFHLYMHPFGAKSVHSFCFSQEQDL